MRMPKYRAEPRPEVDYAALATHLGSRSEDRLTLTFAEIETIVGASLPLIARRYAPWWRGHPKARCHHRTPWRAAGWRVESVDPYAGTVTFTRDATA